MKQTSCLTAHHRLLPLQGRLLCRGVLRSTGYLQCAFLSLTAHPCVGHRVATAAALDRCKQPLGAPQSLTCLNGVAPLCADVGH